MRALYVMISNDNLKNNKPYYVYIIECANGSLYTGITTDIDRRLIEHKSKKVGAKYTRAFGAKKVMALWATKNCENAKSNAMKLESRIKKLTRAKKIELIKDRKQFDNIFIDFAEKDEFIRSSYA